VSEGLSDERLAEIEQRCAAATPGPWAVDLDRPFTLGGDTVSVDAMTGDGLCVEREVCSCVLDTDGWPDGPEWLEDAANARFLAHAREDVPALLAEVRRLRALLRAGGEGR
jgi:hypothetical protein